MVAFVLNRQMNGALIILEVEVHYISRGLCYFANKTNTAQETRTVEGGGVRAFGDPPRGSEAPLTSIQIATWCQCEWKQGRNTPKGTDGEESSQVTKPWEKVWT